MCTYSKKLLITLYTALWWTHVWRHILVCLVCIFYIYAFKPMFVTSVVVVLTYAFVTTSLKTKPRNKCTLNIEKQKQNMIFTIPVLAWYKWKIHCPYDWHDLSQFKPSFQNLSSKGSFALISKCYVQVSITHVIPCSLFLFHCVRK